MKSMVSLDTRNLHGIYDLLHFTCENTAQVLLGNG